MSVLIANSGVRFLHHNGHFIISYEANSEKRKPSCDFLTPFPKGIDKKRAEMLLLPIYTLSQYDCHNPQYRDSEECK